MRIRTIALLLLVTVVPSCGYRLSGVGSVVPDEYRSIAVATFLNGTNEPFVDTELTRAVTDEFLNDGRLRVTGPDEADVVLRGKITQFSATALSYTPDSYVKQYRVRLSADARLEDRRSGRILWQERSVDSNLISSYTVEFDTVAVIDPATGLPKKDPVTGQDVTIQELNIGTTKISKQEAIQEASRNLAQTIRSRILEGF